MSDLRLTDLLRTIELFQSVPQPELEQVAAVLREQELSQGEVLHREGDEADAMYFVIGGRIRLSAADAAGGEKVLAYVSDGQFFGELALLTGGRRPATAMAVSDSRVLVLHKPDFEHLLSSSPHVMREMLRLASQRAVQANRQLLAEEPGRAEPHGAGRVYAVFSPRGGSGKTTVAVNLAVRLAARMPDRVALLDLDLTFADVELLMDLPAHASLAAVPTQRLDELDRRTLARYLFRHSAGLHVLLSARRPEEGDAVGAMHVGAALGVMRRQFLATVVDCGTPFSEPMLAALEAADKVILVCTPELSTLRDIRECQRLFGQAIRVDASKLCYVLNQPRPFRVLSRAQLEAALGQPMALEIPHAGEAAVRSAIRQEPLAVTAVDAAFTKAVDKLALALEATQPGTRQMAAGVRTPAPATGRATHGSRKSPGTQRLLRLFRATA